MIGEAMSDESRLALSNEHRSAYPTSRLAPAFDLVDVAAEIARADSTIASVAEGQLRVIAEQIRSLQDQARVVLDRARKSAELHRARCHFQRRAGHVYHLYRRENGELYFSMLSPGDWGSAPPHPFVGSYRLENDQSWTEVERGDEAFDVSDTGTVR